MDNKDTPNTDMFLNVTEVDLTDINNSEYNILLPSNSSKEISKLNELTDADVGELKDVEKSSLLAATKTEDVVNNNDIGLRDELPTNNEELGKSGIYSPNAVGRSSNKRTALIKYAQKSGIGSVVNVPLYHSGFWITLSPLKKRDIVNLQMELADEASRVGMYTNTLVFSNYSGLFASKIFKYIKNMIIATTLKLNDDENIEDYININDLNPLILAVSRSLFPHGLSVIIPCSNVIKDVNKETIEQCTYIGKYKHDVSELFWVDINTLPVTHREQMGKRGANTLTIKEVKEYQDTLPVTSTERVTLSNESGDVKIDIESPSVGKYLEFTTNFIDKLRMEASELLKSNTRLTDVDEAERIITNTIKLHTYLHYVSNITYDGEVFDTPESIIDFLDMIESNKDDMELVLKSLSEYIDRSLIAIVGIANFVCPECDKKQESHKSLIPISVYDYFFMLLHLKYTRLTSKV